MTEEVKIIHKKQVFVFPAKFLPILKELELIVDEIGDNGDDEGHRFVLGLMIQREDGKLDQISDKQFAWLERLHEKYTYGIAEKWKP